VVNAADEYGDALRCLDDHDDDCRGTVEYRMSLSATGRSFPRCAGHWSRRLDQDEETRRRYPALAPSDWSPADCGESWDDDY